MTADIGCVATSWVTEHFGVQLSTEISPAGLTVQELLRLALRRNPRRAHLLVSTVLGKHLAVDPRVVAGTGRLLGELIARRLRDDDAPLPVPLREAARAAVNGTDPAALLGALPAPPAEPKPLLVLGFAETATALGHLVADQLSAADYLHSTRRQVGGVPVTAGFQEGHSHATDHLLLPQPPSLLDVADTVVLVDDEISTGRTAMATITLLSERRPRRHYVIGTLVDLRSAADRRACDDLAARLGTRIDVVALATGSVVLPDGLIETVTQRLSSPDQPPTDRSGPPLAGLDVTWPVGVPDGGRHGVRSADRPALDAAIETAARDLLAQVMPHLRNIGHRPRVLMLGTEEFMYVPLRIALRWSVNPLLETAFQSTTRSPVHAVDEPGYPVRRRHVFPASDTGEDSRFLYNGTWPDGGQPDLVVILLDAAHDRRLALDDSGLAHSLAEDGTRVVVARLDARTGSSQLTRLPEPLCGPAFGSYAADDVRWLLTDLSALDLEGEIADREQLIQSGQAHYAESLPREYQPAAGYRDLFEEVLWGSALRLAIAVGVVTEIVLAERGGPRVVFASLARAGTPIGILMQRWASRFHGWDIPHYAVSIVRGRGIDTVALDHLAGAHDPGDVVFVDGWTGKGAIARELSAALTQVAAAGGPVFSADLAVLADPGYCTRTFGTRDDFLIASACLNSTVSGLVSRTVLNSALLDPDQFHGAKFYRELAFADVSNRLLDSVTDAFDAAAVEVPDQVRAVLESDRRPTFAGWQAVERIRQEYDIPSVNFVKPGVGETTRVLLRRVPWRILLRDSAHPDHAHVRLLAADRGVPLDIRPDLPYSCVGLIRPLSSGDRGEG